MEAWPNWFGTRLTDLPGFVTISCISNPIKMKRFPLALFVGLVMPLCTVVRADGIYADFSTSVGDFTASLNYTAAPQTVANFIGLAEGSRAWIHDASGAVKVGKPFYNGITFHRVIAGFMNQAGSPNGLGTDGPGYVFQDETGNGLLHDTPYKLSMANAGPNTNGSQFFITVAPTSWLDGKHTVFGQVISGQAVVDQINGVATGANDKPLTPVVIHTVGIRREGAAASAFDIHAQGLPLCQGLDGHLVVQPNIGTTWQADEPQPAGSIFKVYRSPDLSGWTLLKETYRAPDQAGVLNHSLDAASLPRAFFQLPCVTYPRALGPASLAGRTISAGIFSESETLNFVFDGTGVSGTGSYVTAGGTTPFAFSLYDAYTRPFAATWIMNTSALGYLRLRCDLNSETGSHIMGRQNLDQYDFSLGGWRDFGPGTLSVSK